MRASELMTPDPVFITPNEPVSRAAEIMRDSGIGIVPVVDDAQRMHLIGVITDRDIAVRVVAEGRGLETAVADVASRELVTIDPQQEIDEAMRLMAVHQLRRLPVCEEDGRLVGIVAQADLARHEPERAGLVLEDISG